jgi:hypothetical protein
MIVRVTEHHIKNGKVGDGCNCPVALAMKDCLNSHLAFVDIDTLSIAPGQYIVTPKIVKDFICDFDDGKSVAPFEFDFEPAPC